MPKVMQKYNSDENFLLKIYKFIMKWLFFDKSTMFIINYKKGVHL